MEFTRGDDMPSFMRAAAAAILAATASAAADRDVTEIRLDWPAPPTPRAHATGYAPAGDGMGMAMPPAPAAGPPPMGSTHELAFAPGRGGEVVVSGQNYTALARIRGNKVTYQRMPANSGPHGLGFDQGGLLWVTLEFAGRVVAFSPSGRKVRDVDVALPCPSCPEPIATHPHGLGLARDGRTVWFTGKATGTVGRIAADGTLATWQLPTMGSLPIYIRPGPDPARGGTRETMWVTELTGNRIAAISVEAAAGAGAAKGRLPRADIREFAIPTANSRPIAIEEGPDGRMWFSEEAGGKVGRIEADGSVSEFLLPTPPGKPPYLLAALAFDKGGNLWLQQYVDHAHPDPAMPDRIVRVPGHLLVGPARAWTEKELDLYPVPTRDTVMHRIAQGPDGALWFTEMNANRVGVIGSR
jgi:virginiamycin B lyase